MEEIGAFSTLIAALYDAGAGQRSFAALAPEIAAAFDSESCVLQMRGGFTGPVALLGLTANFTPERLASYGDYFYQHDIWVNRSMAHPTGVVLGNDDLIADDEYRETIIYRDYTRHMGLFYVMGAQMKLAEPDGAFGVFGVHKPEAAGVFDAQEKLQCGYFISHLRRALQLRERLARQETEQQTMLQALDALTLGVILANPEGQLIFANPVAEAFLRRGDGLAVYGRQLQALDPAADSALQRQIANCARAAHGRGAQAGSVFRITRRAGSPLGLSIYPFMAPRPSDGAPVPAALIFIADPDTKTRPRREELARFYGLTAAEARLFEALLAGETLQHYAGRTGVSLATARTQLAHLFQKTGCSRQTELLREAAGNAVLGLGSR